MSSHQAKKTVAQLRAEKEQRERDFDEGSRLVCDLREAICHIAAHPTTYDDRYSQMNALLVQANRAYELLQFHPDTYEYSLLAGICKGRAQWTAPGGRPQHLDADA